MFVGRTDLLDPEAGTVAEYDGGHHRDLTQHTADNAREEDLEHLNLTVTRSTGLDLWPHRPRLVLRLRTAHRDGCRRDRSRDALGHPAPLTGPPDDHQTTARRTHPAYPGVKIVRDLGDQHAGPRYGELGPKVANDLETAVSTA
jgi:hypothetical protein